MTMFSHFFIKCNNEQLKTAPLKDPSLNQFANKMDSEINTQVKHAT